MGKTGTGFNACLNQFLSQEIPREERAWEQREKLMLARLSLLSGEEAKKRADEICQNINEEFCIYSTLPVIQLLFAHRDVLSVAAREKLEGFLEKNQQEFYRELGKKKCNSFHLIALAGIAAMAVYSDDPEIMVQVSSGVEAFRQHCMKWDAPDEFVSPYYSAWQLGALAILAELLPEGEEKETALAIENYIFRSLLERCHPALGQLAGPYSRGYTSELCGHPQAVLGTLEAVLGDGSPFSMAKMLWQPERDSRLLYHGSLSCMRVETLYFAAIDYHLDESLIRHWNLRGFPYLSVCRTHTDGSYDVSMKKNLVLDRDYDFPPGEVLSQVWMDHRHAVGWSDREYENGMACNSFCLMYEKDSMTRTCFTKMAAGEKALGQWNTFQGIGMTLSESNFPDEGRKQVDRTEDGWLVQYQPRDFLKEMKNIKLIWAFPEHFGPVDKIESHGRELAIGHSLPVPCEIGIKDGFMDIRLSFMGKTGKVKLVRNHRFLTLEWEKTGMELAETNWDVLVSCESQG